MILQFLTLLELNFPFEGGGGRQCLGSKGTEYATRRFD